MLVFIDPTKLEEAMSIATSLDDSLVDRSIQVSKTKDEKSSIKFNGGICCGGHFVFMCGGELCTSRFFRS